MAGGSIGTGKSIPRLSGGVSGSALRGLSAAAAGEKRHGDGCKSEPPGLGNGGDERPVVEGDHPPARARVVHRRDPLALRHRREGLAYRLTWRRRGVAPRKRVQPSAAGLPLRRRMVYRMRAHIARWSHRVFWLARATRLPGLYLAWARGALAIYQAVAWSRGSIGRLLDRLMPT